MTSSTPTPLRLYTEPALATEAPAAAVVELDSLADVCAAFERATGWTLRYVPQPMPTHDPDLLWSAPVNPGVGTSPGHLRIDLGGGELAASGPRVDLERACELAAGIARTLVELTRTRQELWKREAELALGVPLISRARDESHLAQRLEAVLKGGAQAVGCQAAAVYLLDSATTELKLRSAWNLPADRFFTPARPLGTATADLEALAGHAVVLEEPNAEVQWNPPERFGAAVCVPISSATVPMGTLWVFSNEARAFSDDEVNVVEIIAGRLASDLEREILLNDGVEAAQSKRQLDDAERFQESLAPRVPPSVDGWEVAAFTLRAGRIASDFYEWFLTQDDSLALALGDCTEQGLAAALFGSAARAAVRAHGEATPQPHLLLAGVNRTLWSSSSGDQVASLFGGLLDPRGGRLRFAWAGCPGALLLRPSGWEPLTSDSLELGRRPDAEFEPHERQMQPGDALLVLTSGARGHRGEDGQRAGDIGLAEALWPELDAPANHLAALARSRLERAARTGATHDRSVLILKRRQ